MTGIHCDLNEFIKNYEDQNMEKNESDPTENKSHTDNKGKLILS
jgi:hypothetical protein